MSGSPFQNQQRFGFTGSQGYGGMFPGLSRQQPNQMSGLARYSPYSPLNLGFYQSPLAQTFQAPQVNFQRVSAQPTIGDIYRMALGYSPSDFSGGGSIADAGIANATASASDSSGNNASMGEGPGTGAGW